MTAPVVTVRHNEAATEVAAMTGQSWRLGIDVTAELIYTAGQTHAALEAVDRLAGELRRQIADAAERDPAPEAGPGPRTCEFVASWDGTPGTDGARPVYRCRRCDAAAEECADGRCGCCTPNGADQ